MAREYWTPSRHSAHIQPFALEMWIGGLKQPVGGVGKEQEEVGVPLRKKHCGLRMLRGRALEVNNFLAGHLVDPVTAELTPQEEDGQAEACESSARARPGFTPAGTAEGISDAPAEEGSVLRKRELHVARMEILLINPAAQHGTCRSEYQAIGLEGLATPFAFPQPFNLILGTSMCLVPERHVAQQYSRYPDLLALVEKEFVFALGPENLLASLAFLMAPPVSHRFLPQPPASNCLVALGPAARLFFHRLSECHPESHLELSHPEHHPESFHPEPQPALRGDLPASSRLAFVAHRSTSAGCSSLR